MSQKLRQRKTGTVMVLLLMLGGMTTLVAFSVPLYRLFCQVTGYQGTTQTADAAPVEVGDKVVKVRFNTDVNDGLPWSFTAPEPVKVKIGERRLVIFKSHNDGDRAISGTAVFNVTPSQAGPYFDKIQCFCFTEQTLAAGETASMPVSFFIDPKIEEDWDARQIKTITLSYTFYPSADSDKQTAAHAEEGARPAATVN